MAHLPTVIVNIYVVKGYLNQSIRNFYFIQQEELSGEHFLRSITEKHIFFSLKPKAAISMLLKNLDNPILFFYVESNLFVSSSKFSPSRDFSEVLMSCAEVFSTNNGLSKTYKKICIGDPH